MKYSIFHTSECGSTLLACMLSDSIDVVTEPKWSHEIRHTDDMDKKIELVNKHHKENLLVKYSSLCTEVAPYVEGKKVFLFRNILDHLNKIQVNKNEAKFWLYRWNNLIESKDVLFMSFEQFMENKHKACQDICNHFNINYVPLPDIDFHVKDKGYNHNDEPIRLRQDV